MIPVTDPSNPTIKNHLNLSPPKTLNYFSFNPKTANYQKRQVSRFFLSFTSGLLLRCPCWGLDKVVIACDERIAAKAAGLDQRPLTRRAMANRRGGTWEDDGRWVSQTNGWIWNGWLEDVFFFNGSLQKGDMSMFILVVVVCWKENLERFGKLMRYCIWVYFVDPLEWMKLSWIF